MSSIKFEAVLYEDDPFVKTRTKVGMKKIKVDSCTLLEARLKASGRNK